MLNTLNKNVNVMEALNTLNIKYQGHPNSKGWLSIICVFHQDKDYGNASVNVNSGVISCYKCGVTKHISTLLKERGSNYTYTPPQVTTPNKPEVKKSSIDSSMTYRFIHKEIDNPEDFYYLKQRGFTKEFCKEFKIVRSFTDPYSDYFAYCIQDTNKNIKCVEFRKLMQFEYLQTYYDSHDITYEQLSKDFKECCKNNNIHISDYKLYKGNEIIVDRVLFYLLDKKVKYESGSFVKNTIFNIDHLNYDEPLYLTEGIGSIPKLWDKVSKNCSCTFGSQISDAQLEYLKKFKEVYVIPDNDLAGLKMVLKLRDSGVKLTVININVEDTDENFVSEILLTNNYCTVEEYLSKSILKYNKTLF